MPEYLILEFSVDPITDSTQHPDLRISLSLTKLAEASQCNETSEHEADRWIMTTGTAEKLIQGLQLTLDCLTEKDALDASTGDQ